MWNDMYARVMTKSTAVNAGAAKIENSIMGFFGVLAFPKKVYTLPSW